MASANPQLTLIVATTAKNGIGKGGGLPWPMLKKEMAYFARVTKRVPSTFQQQHGGSNGEPTTSSTKQVRNVVIMGRKTWDSIPSKLRPLKERTNIVITRQGRAGLFGPGEGGDVIVAGSIEEGIRGLHAHQYATGRIFVIGGAAMYDAALKEGRANRVLLTRIHREYECDTFFPVDLDEDKGWKKASSKELSEFVEEQVGDADMEETVGEETVRYRFQLYERE